MSEPLRFALWLSALHTLTFFTIWGGFALLFRFDALKRFQIAGGKPPPDAALSRLALREVLFGQALFPVVCYFAIYPLWTLTGGRMTGQWPPLPHVVGYLLAFIAVEDTIFYFSHRLMHTRWLFSHVHYRHHRFRIVRVPVAEFAHPLENLINLIALFAGPVALGAPFPVVALWMVVRIAETVEAHSGYALSPVSSRHSFHHLHAQRGCYGSFVSPWDMLLGTDRMWREWRKSQRQAALQPDVPVTSE
jgi:sterol desaturase/sphingolipid hydroxylase (fatty acid hydroxylase superfamily)